MLPTAYFPTSLWWSGEVVSPPASSPEVQKMLWRTLLKSNAREKDPLWDLWVLLSTTWPSMLLKRGCWAEQTPDSSAQQSPQHKLSSNSSQAQSLDHDPASWVPPLFIYILYIITYILQVLCKKYAPFLPWATMAYSPWRKKIASLAEQGRTKLEMLTSKIFFFFPSLFNSVAWMLKTLINTK